MKANWWIENTTGKSYKQMFPSEHPMEKNKTNGPWDYFVSEDFNKRNKTALNGLICVITEKQIRDSNFVYW